MDAIAEELKRRMFPEALDVVVLELSMPPTTNNLFINRGKSRIDSPKYAAWKRLAGWELVRQHPPRIRGPVSLLIEVSLAESNDTWDVTNRTKATEDLLKTQGVIQGDNRPFVREVTTRWADVAGVRVTIKSLAP